MPALFLYYRQTYSVDFLIDVERIYVGHSADEVYDGHNPCLYVGAADVVLTAESPDELFGVELLGVYGSVREGFHQCLHYLVTA